jgi:4-aminobutyrate aminotransferase-like enzyme
VGASPSSNRPEALRGGGDGKGIEGLGGDPMSPPGPESRRLSELLARFEAPGVNTLAGGEPSLVWAEAEGSTVTDVDGNRYLDLTAGFGVAAVGHRHPRVVAAVREQAGRLLHGLGDVAAHPTRVELARRLAGLVPAGEGLEEPDEARKVHFAVSGADAVEVAAKTAILATGRPGLIAFEPSYHGLTLGALALTAREHFRQPFRHHLHPHVHRLPYGCDPERLTERLASGEVAAVVVEPIVGREGVILPPAGWLREVAGACREHGALLVADEIFTGFGRTGETFAVDHDGVRPDLVCCGKALGGGLPLGAVVGGARAMDAWAAEGEARHTGTFLANPLACAAALAVLDVMAEDDLPARATRLGERVAERLATWPARFPAVVETRGRGLLWGVETETTGQAKRTTTRLLERGVLALAGGPAGNVLQIVPPLTIPEADLDEALHRFEESLGSGGDDEPV